LLDIRLIIFESLESGFSHMVTSVLTVFIVIDLFKAFVDYQENDRIRLTDITDATIFIVLREIAVGLYSQEFGYEFILSLAALLFVLSIMRVLAIKYSPAKSRAPGADTTTVQSEGQTAKQSVSAILDKCKAASESN